LSAQKNTRRLKGSGVINGAEEIRTLDLLHTMRCGIHSERFLVVAVRHRAPLRLQCGTARLI